MRPRSTPLHSTCGLPLFGAAGTPLHSAHSSILTITFSLADYTANHLWMSFATDPAGLDRIPEAALLEGSYYRAGGVITQSVSTQGRIAIDLLDLPPVAQNGAISTYRLYIFANACNWGCNGPDRLPRAVAVQIKTPTALLAALTKTVPQSTRPDPGQETPYALAQITYDASAKTILATTLTAL